MEYVPHAAATKRNANRNVWSGARSLALHPAGTTDSDGWLQGQAARLSFFLLHWPLHLLAGIIITSVASLALLSSRIWRVCSALTKSWASSRLRASGSADYLGLTGSGMHA